MLSAQTLITEPAGRPTNASPLRWGPCPGYLCAVLSLLCKRVAHFFASIASSAHLHDGRPSHLPPSQMWLADRIAACPGPGPPSDSQPRSIGNSALAHTRGNPSALDQLSRRHSPGNVLHEFARGGVLASLPAMIAEAGEGDGAPGERPAPPGADYEGPMGSGREVLLQVRSSSALLPPAG